MHIVTEIAIKVSVLFFLLSSAAAAQVTYTAVPEASEIWIDGSSNNGEWNEYAEEFSVEMTMAEEPTAEEPGLESVVTTIPAKQVVSRKSVIMDKLTHNAFKASDHPEITFELSSAEVIEPGKLKTTGNLTLAGVTNEIEMEVTFNELEDGRMHVVGSYGFNMTEFEIDPPTALFGRFRVADPVVVHFDLTMAP